VFEAEPEEPNAMQRPPHERDASIFESSLLWLGVLQGVLLLVAVIGVYLWARQSGAEEDEVRTLAFCTLVIGNIGLIFTNRSHSAGWLDILRTPNMVLWVTTSAALLVLGAVLGVPALRGAFHFSVPSAGELAVAAAAAIACMVLFEALKGLRRNIGKARHANTAA
jgi:Ca2+-transporting ATPase